MIPVPDSARRAVKSGLRRARRRWFVAEWARVGTMACLLLSTALLSAAVVGVVVTMPRGALAAVLLLALGAGALAAGAVAWPLRRRPSDVRVARYVEERCPELDDRLTSAAHILAHGERTGLAALVLRDAATAVAALDFDRVVARSALGRSAAALVGGAIVAALCAWWAFGPLRPAFDAMILRFAPSVVAIEVEPGSIDVAEGTPVVVRARVRGLFAFDGPVSLLTDGGDGARRVEMAPEGERFWHEIVPVDHVRYRVQAGSVVTRAFEVTVRRAPRVARIDVHYAYPPFTGLRPRTQQDAGDIYAPAGSSATLTVHTTHPAAGGDIRFSGGSSVPLAGTATRFEVPLRIDSDGSYRLVLRDSAGTEVPDDTEYFIRIVDDRPPDVRVVRPAGDRRVTPLEELVVEVRADDDHGVERLDLIYAAAGGAERVVPLHRGGTQTSASGAAMVFVEDLDVEPGDFVTFYARARDVARGKRSTEVQSDMFFLEVRPFSEEFQLAQTQAFQAAGGSMDDLAARQKDIVIATWNIERRSAAGRSRDDIAALARAQRELRERALRSAESAAALQPARRRRGAEPRPEEPVTPSTDDPMRRATEVMETAAVELERLRPAQALPHEREALSWLLKARADVRRRQVARQQSGGGDRGATGNEDLSALFDRELLRQQSTNYESRPTLETRAESKESEALSRLKELARRQDDLARRQQELAREASRMTEAEVRRRLERLTREQQELERALGSVAERRPAETGGSRDEGPDRGDRSALDGAREAARDVTRSLQRGEMEGAARAAARAREQIADAARRIDTVGRGGSGTASLGELQLEARESAETARRLAEQLGSRGEQATAGDRGRGSRESMAQRQDELASRIDRLEAATASAVSRPGAERGLRQAVGEFGRQQLGDSLRREASALRRADGAGRDDTTRGAAELEAAAAALDKFADRLASAGGLDAQGRQLSNDLARTRSTRDRLEQLAREIERGFRQQGEGDPNRLSREFAREARQSGDVIDALRNQQPELAAGLAAIEGTGVSRSAPGTEAFKQDFAAWDALRAQVLLSLERLEASQADRLAVQADRERVAAGADDRTTEAYRLQVDRYFRAIAGTSKR